MYPTTNPEVMNAEELVRTAVAWLTEEVTYRTKNRRALETQVAAKAIYTRMITFGITSTPRVMMHQLIRAARESHSTGVSLASQIIQLVEDAGRAATDGARKAAFERASRFARVLLSARSAVAAA